MSKNATHLHRAIRFAQTGEILKARRLLASILNEDRSNELAWRWFVETYPTTREKYLVYQKWQKALPMSREAAHGLRQFSTVYFPISKSDRSKRPILEKAPPVWSLVLLFIITFVVSFGIFTAGQQTAFAQFDEPQQVIVSQPITPVKPASTLVVPDQAIEDEPNPALLEENAELEQQVEDLNEALSISEESVAELSEDVATLTSEKEGLEQDIFELKMFVDEQISLPNVQLQDKTVTFAFARRNGQPLFFDIPYHALVETNSLSADSFRYHRYQSVSANNMTGSVLDCRTFIQTEYFEEMMQKMQLEYNDNYLLLEQVWLIVSQVELTERQLTETPQFPIETLVNGGGVEDKAILMASMLKAAPVHWDVSLYYVDATSLKIKHSPNDLMLKVVFDGRTFYIDPDGTTMTPHDAVDGWEFLIN